MEPLLKIGGLTVELPTAQGSVRPVNDVSLRIQAGEGLGLHRAKNIRSYG